MSGKCHVDVVSRGQRRLHLETVPCFSRVQDYLDAKQLQRLRDSAIRLIDATRVPGSCLSRVCVF